MIHTQINNYTITKKIGEGGMATVYIAKHRVLDKTMAVKILNLSIAENEDIRRRFEREAITLDKLKHQNIVEIHDFGEIQGRPFLFMDYVKGYDMDTYIKKVTGLIPPEKAVNLVIQMLDALGYAHKAGIIHRDIKPSNFIVTDDNTVKVLDFGIAKILSDDPNLMKTKTGLKIGTPQYMSPEQIKGEKVDKTTDIYSLGITLFQMLAGRLPYSSKLTEWELSNKIVFEPLPPIKEFYPHVSDDLQKIVDKATAKKPENRFASCEDFKQALLAVQQNKPVDIPDAPISKNPQTPSKLQKQKKSTNRPAAKPQANFSKITGIKDLYKAFMITYFSPFALILLFFAIAESGGIENEAAVLFLSISYLSYIASFVLSMVILHRGWQSVADNSPGVSPGTAVGYLFIPFLNFYWIFIAFRKLFIEMKKYNPGTKAGYALPTLFAVLIVILPAFAVIDVLMMEERIYEIPVLLFISNLLIYIFVPIVFTKIKNNTVYILKHGKSN